MAKPKTAHPVDLILESSSALFICGAIFAVISLILFGEHSPKALIVATSLPAAASLLLLVAALLVPGIYAVGKMAFPLNLTLPLIHGSLVYMFAELTRGSFGLEKPPADLQPALWWDNLIFLGLAVIFQIVLMTALIGIRPHQTPSEPTPDVQR